jgi:hypothetical protein
MFLPVARAAAAAMLMCAVPFVSAQVSQSTGPVSTRNFFFAGSAGLTFGGDTLATVRFTNGETDKIQAGGLVHLSAGVLWAPVEMPLSVQLMAGYHVDDVSASNGDLRFTRYPIEALVFYNGIKDWRFGAGARHASSPRLKTDLGGVTSQTEFKNANGFIAEVGYQFTRYFWVNARYVREDYKVERFGSGGSSITLSGTSKGDHGGIYMLFVL